MQLKINLHEFQHSLVSIRVIAVGLILISLRVRSLRYRLAVGRIVAIAFVLILMIMIPIRSVRAEEAMAIRGVEIARAGLASVLIHISIRKL